MTNAEWIVIGSGPEPTLVPENGKVAVWPPNALLVKIGDPVFIAGGRYRTGRIEYWINTGKFKLSDAGKIGDTVFFNVKDAEDRIAEWMEKNYDPTYDRY